MWLRNVDSRDIEDCALRLVLPAAALARPPREGAEADAFASVAVAAGGYLPVAPTRNVRPRVRRVGRREELPLDRGHR